MKENKRLTYIILSIIILILLAINIMVFINKYEERNPATNNTNQNQTNRVITNAVSEEVDNKNRETLLASLTEKNRMQTYFGTYISYIENKDYEGAYNLLYDNFKATYFPTIQDFQKYAEEKYPSNMVINYTDISREGTIYILTLEIRDVLSNSNSEAKSTKAVIMEEDINNFKISFEVDR